MKNYIWRDRKRTLFGLPLSFTIYTLTEEKLFIETGFFNKKQEEIRLYRILDVTLHRKLSQRIFGVGTIHCCSGDKSTPEFNIVNIKRPSQIIELLSDKVEEQRSKKRISTREVMSDSEDAEEEY